MGVGVVKTRQLHFDVFGIPGDVEHAIAGVARIARVRQCVGLLSQVKGGEKCDRSPLEAEEGPVQAQGGGVIGDLAVIIDLGLACRGPPLRIEAAIRQGVVAELLVTGAVIKVGTEVVLAGEAVAEIDRAVEGVSPFTGDDADHAGLGIAVLGGKAAGHHLHLLDGLHGDVGEGAAPVSAAQEQVAHARSVDEPLDLVLAAAAHRITGLALARRTEPASDRDGIEKDPGLGHQPLLGVAHGDARKLGDADVLDAGGDVLLDDRGLGVDGHLLVERDRLIHHPDPEVGGQIDLDGDIFDHHSLAADHARPEGIGSGGHLEDEKLAVQIRGGTEGGSDENHIGPGQRRTRISVDRDTPDLAGRAGCERADHGQEQQQHSLRHFHFFQRVPPDINSYSLIPLMVNP
ncbi:MAG: hypothetical protein BWY77_01156 [bacterium ADurb.Bin431]|nr:MAG: hypothetical protein BWY77_01156 [bacterium ADurb.Bin431]